MASRAGVAVVVAASALLLVGCSATPPPPGLTDAEREQFRISRLDSVWRLTGLPDEKRPVVAAVAYLPPDTRAEHFSRCITELAPGNVYSRGINSSLEISLTGGSSEAQILAEYECSARYPYRPQDLGFYSAAQLAAIYDYYDRWLIPCLIDRGYTVTFPEGRPPTAATAGYVAWNPINTIRDRAGDPRVTLGPGCKPYPSFVERGE
jgi:hypothetical protein